MMEEALRRALALAVMTSAALLLLSLALRPRPSSGGEVSALAAAAAIRDCLLSFKPLVVLLKPGGLGSLRVVVAPRQPAVAVPSIEVVRRALRVAVVFSGERALSRTLEYSVIALPSSGLVIPRDANFSSARTVVVHGDGSRLYVELVPYCNCTRRGWELLVELFLFRCSLEPKERMAIRFLGCVEAARYLRCYEGVGAVEVYLDGRLVVREYAKAVVLRVVYEVWEIG